MGYKVGDKVLCPPSGMTCGPRKGVVIRKSEHPPFLVRYYDPADKYNNEAWVHPIRKIE